MVRLIKSSFILKDCLLRELPKNIHVLAKAGDYRLVEMHLDDSVHTLIHKKKGHCGKLLNVSRYFHQSKTVKANPSAILHDLLAIKPGHDNQNFAIKHQKQVKQAISRLKPIKYGRMLSI